MIMSCYECGQDLSNLTAEKICDFCGATLLLQLPGFPERYEAMEYIHSGKQSDVFVVKRRNDGAFLLAKFYKSPSKSVCDEESMLSHLDHPSIPKIVDSFETEDTVCIVRDYVQGISLNKLSFSLDEEQIIDIGKQLCDILTYLHSQEPPVIHRDIKPQNVILDDNERVHLIDFGISRNFSEKALKDTVHIGTEGFMPPEQYGFSQTDCRADIYSMGVLLCWLLTGKMNPDGLSTSGSEHFTNVIKKCTAFAPENRYPTAAAVKNALLHDVQ